MSADNENKPVVIYFDGVCNLCNGVASTILRLDRKHRFKFSSLQSSYARAHLPAELTDSAKSFQSIVLEDEFGIKVRAQAAIAAAEILGGVWNVALIFKLLPPSLLDFVYKLVAKNRYRLFGKKDQCRLITPEEKAFFLE